MTDRKIMPEDDLRRLQLIQTGILAEVDKICRKNNIEYFLAFGTLLGAVRHQGFIPWDDDLDVMMKRKEYDKFCEVCKTQLDTEKYFLQNYKTDSEYRWGFAKIRRKGTKYIRAGQEAIKCNSGISLDIFVMDYVPDNIIGRIFFHYIRRGCVKTLWSIVGATEEKNPFLRSIYKIIRHIPKQVPNKIMEKMGTATNKSEKEYICSMGFYRNIYFNKYPFSTGMKSQWLQEHKELEFEGRKYFVCSKYHEYLECIYGDYMKLPKEEDRLVHTAKYYDFGEA